MNTPDGRVLPPGSVEVASEAYWVAAEMGASPVPLIEMRSVSKRFARGSADVAVLENVSLTIREGEFVALMGPSGSGKTTLLNLIGGLDHPSSGEVAVGGQRLSTMSDGQLSVWRAQHIGLIFQFYNLIPVLTAERNVEVPLLLSKLSRRERRERVDVALQAVGLSDRGKYLPTELSGGQEQRVAIARAIVSDPALLLCDEPTGDLDRATAEEILSLLQLLNREFHKTVVMVTHDARAASFAMRTIYLDKGRLNDEQQ